MLLATAAHIVRQNVPEWAAATLFGKAETAAGHIWNAKNRIPLSTLYEAMLDSAKIAIVLGEEHGELKVLVLDEEESQREYPGPHIPPMGKDLHQSSSQLRHSLRPRRAAGVWSCPGIQFRSDGTRRRRLPSRWHTTRSQGRCTKRRRMTKERRRTKWSLGMKKRWTRVYTTDDQNHKNMGIPPTTIFSFQAAVTRLIGS